MVGDLDWTSLELSIQHCRRELGLADDRIAFTHFVLESTLGIDSGVVAETITDGGNDQGIDAVYFDQNASTAAINLFQIKFHNEQKARSRNFPASEIPKIKTFINELFDRNISLLARCNDLLREKVEQMYEILDDPEAIIRVHLCSNGLSLKETDRREFEEFLATCGKCFLQEHDLVALCANISGAKRPVRNAKIKFQGNQIFEKDNGLYRGIVASIQAKELTKILNHPSLPGHIDGFIFSENVRTFLGFENELNEIIYQSSISSENHLFWYLNNGITIVCNSFSCRTKIRSGTILLNDYQIVNGQQTCHALFEAGQRGSAALSDVLILVRIYEISDANVQLKVSQATNSQTRISLRDIRSNDDIQKKIESVLQKMGYFYERKRGQKYGNPVGKILDSLKLGQISLSYLLLEPERARTRSDDIFDYYYRKIFHENINIKEIILAYEVFKEIEIKKKIILENMRNTRSGNIDLRFMSYGNYHVLSAFRMVSDHQGHKIEQKENWNSNLALAIEAIRQVVARNRGRALYEIFRDSRTIDQTKYFIKTEFDGLQESAKNMGTELAITSPQSDLFD